MFDLYIDCFMHLLLDIYIDLWIYCNTQLLLDTNPILCCNCSMLLLIYCLTQILFEGERINCSKFDSSKKLVDTKNYQLLTASLAVDKKKWKLVDCPYLTGFDVGSTWFEQLIVEVSKILTAQIVTGQQRFWKMSTARHNL